MPRNALAFLVIAGLLSASLTVPVSAQSGSSLLVSVSDLSGMLKDPKLVILHVADRAAAFEDAHIPGARFLRYGEFAVPGTDNVGSELPAADAVKQLFDAVGVSDDTRVVIYSQGPVMAARAFFTLDAFGHARVALLDGGLKAWRDAGQPVERGATAAPRPGSFTPRLNPQRIADAADIQKQAPGKSLALVDVRPDDEFFGPNTMGGAHAPGHIAGARQLTWNSLMAPDGKFLPAAELRQRLEAVGAVAGKPLVAYCMVGMRASVVYFVSRHLGLDARLYDGSMVDWSRKGLPTTQTKN